MFVCVHVRGLSGHHWSGAAGLQDLLAPGHAAEETRSGSSWWSQLLDSWS